MTGRSLAFFAFAGASSAVLAQERPPRVALVVETIDDPVARRLRAELAALGFEVVDVAASGDAGRATLEAVARGESAVAALRVVPSENGVEVWIVDRVTGKTVLREVVTADASGRAEEVVPVRAVELLRASLMEIDAPHPVRGEVPPPANVRAIVPRPRTPPRPPPRFALSLGPAILFSPGNISSAGEMRVAVGYRPTDSFGVSVIGLVPALAAYVETTDFRSDISPWVGGVSADLYLAPRGARWTPVAGLGLGGVLLRMAGQGTRGQVDTTTGTAPFVRAGAVLVLTPVLRVGAEALSGLLFPETTVVFSRTPVATWGRPFVSLSAGIEVAW